MCFVAVDHHHLVADGPYELFDGPAHPAAAADHQVAAQVVDVALHAEPPELAGKPTLDDALNDRRGAVEHRAGASEYEHRGVGLPSGIWIAVGDLPESDCGDGDDGLVGGVDKAESEHRVARRAQNQDA